MHKDSVLEEVKNSILKDPNNPENLRNMGLLMQMKGLMQPAMRALLLALQKDPRHARTHYTLSRQLNYQDQPKLLDKLSNLNPDDYQTDDEKVHLCFAKASVYDRLRDYKQAEKWLTKANQTKRMMEPSDLELIKAMAHQRQQQFDKKTNNYTAESKSDRGIIFIVGLPRCGSTLLSSILSMNPYSEDLGECEVLESCLQRFYENAANFPRDNIGRDYIRIARSRSEKTYLIDKSLYNFLNLGLIRKQLPNARIIHCVRDPLAHALSIHRTKFSQGSTYATSVKEIGEMLLLEREIMLKNKRDDHGQIFTVRYEKLCQSPQKEISALLNWLGWPWDPRYLKHHQTKNKVETASLVQVREAIHTRSTQSWRNYPATLRPIIECFKNNPNSFELL